MGKRMTRRELCRDVDAAGVTTVLAVGAGKAQTPTCQSAQAALDGGHALRARMGPHETHLVELTAGDMIVAFDQRYGSISSITQEGDPLGTNFIGNEHNTPGVDTANSRWIGDLVTQVWDITDTNPAHRHWSPRSQFILEGKWRPELTGRSDDIRRVSFDAGTFAVNYDGASKNEGGIRSFSLAIKYRSGEGPSLLWEVELRNVTDHVLEIGELGFPLMVNDDQGEFYRDPKTGQPFPADDTEHPLRIPADYFSVYREQYPRIQKQYHEQKVIAHYFAGGHSSYALIQRPLGNAPFLLLYAMEDTSFECVYRDGSSFGQKVYWWEGPNILAVHSWATKVLRNWDKNPWVNGHTSLVLQPGGKWSGRLRFVFVESYDAIRDEICKAGNLGIRVLPAMVVQENADAFVELRTKTDVEKMDFLSDNITVKEKMRVDDKTLLTLSFKGRGQKSLKLHYGGRWTNLTFTASRTFRNCSRLGGGSLWNGNSTRTPRIPIAGTICFCLLTVASGALSSTRMKCRKWVAATPNSAFPSLCSWLRRTSTILFLETFVDPERYCGTCYRAAGFCCEFGNDDESYLNALVHTFEQADAIAMTLPVNSRDSFLARLDRVRIISHNLGYGVGDSTDDILAEYT